MAQVRGAHRDRVAELVRKAGHDPKALLDDLKKTIASYKAAY